MLGTVLQQAIRNSMWVYTKDIKATKSDISISLEQTNLEIIFSSSLERLLKCRSFKYIMKSLLCTHAFNNNFQKNLNLKQIYFTVKVIMTTLFPHTQKNLYLSIDRTGNFSKYDNSLETRGWTHALVLKVLY